MDELVAPYPEDVSKYYCACERNCNCGELVDRPGEVCPPCCFHGEDDGEA